ncbi:hypothetical protein ACOME3_010795 [Neoechinorhynchus agilis]
MPPPPPILRLARNLDARPQYEDGNLSALKIHGPRNSRCHKFAKRINTIVRNAYCQFRCSATKFLQYKSLFTADVVSLFANIPLARALDMTATILAERCTEPKLDIKAWTDVPNLVVPVNRHRNGTMTTSLYRKPKVPWGPPEWTGHRLTEDKIKVTRSYFRRALVQLHLVQ